MNLRTLIDSIIAFVRDRLLGPLARLIGLRLVHGRETRQRGCRRRGQTPRIPG